MSKLFFLFCSFPINLGHLWFSTLPMLIDDKFGINIALTVMISVPTGLIGLLMVLAAISTIGKILVIALCIWATIAFIAWFRHDAAESHKIPNDWR